MNAPIIQANYHQLARIATIFARHAERSGELHRNLRRQTDALVGSAWQGEAAQRFHAEMDSELLPALRRLAEALDEAKSITWQICDILRTAENEAAALFRTERRETVQYGGGSDGFAAWLEEMSDGLAARLQEASDGLASMLTEVAAVLTGQSDCEGGTRGGGGGGGTAGYGGDREAEPNLTAHYLDDPPPTITIANGHKSVKDPTFLPYGELAPGTRFRRNDYLYQTDDQGRVISVTGQLGAQAHPRYPYYERVVGNSGGIATDDGGHLVASRFGGVSEGVNLVPMNAALNRAGGDWYRMEQRWAAALERGERVEVNIRPIYEGVSDRPARFVVDYWIDGRPFTIEFDNTLER